MPQDRLNALAMLSMEKNLYIPNVVKPSLTLTIESLRNWLLSRTEGQNLCTKSRTYNVAFYSFNLCKYNGVILKYMFACFLQGLKFDNLNFRP